MKAASFFERLVDRLQPFPWLSMAGLVLALLAQYFLEPVAHALPAFIIYIAALGFILWGILRDEWRLSPLPHGMNELNWSRPRAIPLVFSLLSLAGAFYLLGGNHFTILNLLPWSAGAALFILAWWTPGKKDAGLHTDTEWIALLAAVLVLAAFFRFYRLDDIPAEPFSDHAEKLLDVLDISRGRTAIFFERNTGREAIQMYWTLLVAEVFGTGISFPSLKLGTALLGFLTLPFIYWLGREYGNPLVGFLALFMFGIAYWPNVISRVGLRFPLYPLFAAPTLLYLTRGLRAGSRNDFLLCGIFLGLGLHGYSPFRIMPFVVMAAFLIFMLHSKTKEARLQAVRGLGLAVITALILFMPLLRYWMEHADVFGFRALSRLGFADRGIPGNPWFVLMSNSLRALLMFNWDDGGIWVNSIPHRPALDLVSAALFVIGLVLLSAGYLRGRDWRDLFLLLSIPLLLLPSILSLAYPLENPALNRASGAAVVAVLVSARALAGLLAAFESAGRRAWIGYAITAVLLSVSALQNYGLVFRQFEASYRLAVWNSSEIAKVIEDHGDHATAWIVPYPQWVDTRLPAVWLGIVDHDFALWPDEFRATEEVHGSKLFIFKPEDIETENVLKQLYPGGTLSRYTSLNLGKDFMIFVVED